MQLSEKESVRLEIQGLLDQFYCKQNQNGNDKRLTLYFQLFSGLLPHSLLETLVNGWVKWKCYILFCFSEELNDVVNQSLLKELQEERAEKVCVCSPASSIIICLWQ